MPGVPKVYCLREDNEIIVFSLLPSYLCEYSKNKLFGLFFNLNCIFSSIISVKINYFSYYAQAAMKEVFQRGFFVLSVKRVGNTAQYAISFSIFFLVFLID